MQIYRFHSTHLYTAVWPWAARFSFIGLAPTKNARSCFRLIHFESSMHKQMSDFQHLDPNPLQARIV